MRTGQPPRWRHLAVATAAIVAAPLVATPIATADPGTGVSGWAERHAVPVPDSARPGLDLAVLAAETRGAEIVALGEFTHGTREVTALKRRAVEFLVERLGFRTLAWEEDWTLGVMINDYVHGRRDDITALVRQMSPAWRTEEVVDVFTWVREHNLDSRPADRVDVVGAEYFSTRALAFDAIEDYVAGRAPERLPELLAHRRLLRPSTENMFDWLTAYRQLENKQPHLDAAAAVLGLVTDLAGGADDEASAITLHHARQIQYFYTAFSLPDPEIPEYRDARAADNLRWWQRRTGDRMMYWAAGAHAATADEVTISAGPQPPAVFTPVGAYLDDWYRDDYVRIGYTASSGAALSYGRVVDLPPAPAGWFEAPLADVDRTRFMLRLDRRHLPGPVRGWLTAPMVTRGYPELGTASTMTGGTPAEWYDVLVHTRTVTAMTPLPGLAD